jgi:hypothetical protein
MPKTCSLPQQVGRASSAQSPSLPQALSAPSGKPVSSKQLTPSVLPPAPEPPLAALPPAAGPPPLLEAPPLAPPSSGDPLPSVELLEQA